MAALCDPGCPVFQEKMGQLRQLRSPAARRQMMRCYEYLNKTTTYKQPKKRLIFGPMGLLCAHGRPMSGKAATGRPMMTTIYINDGKPTAIWHGISHAALLARCADARWLNMPDAADTMSYIASMMMACEPIGADEFAQAEHALYAVERTLMDTFIGPVRLNKRGQIWAGHPALGYSQAPAQRQEVRP